MVARAHWEDDERQIGGRETRPAAVATMRVRGGGGFYIVNTVSLADERAWLAVIAPSNQGNPPLQCVTMRVRGRGGFPRVTTDDGCSRTLGRRRTADRRTRPPAVATMRVRGGGGFYIVNTVSLADERAWLAVIAPSNQGNPPLRCVTMRVRGRGGFCVVNAVLPADAYT
jgi:hypothetical protein